ncbi:hypothetical protein [Streptomyces virginiae]|uniref:hypothetical protein n=1 Tax=Streptomyces virginiae TaxID=1961 RepID=UPI002DBE1954|nr:hypothetical protein [Streptomyces sp. CMAA1738]MEC4570490.1 hypothetical protein [Streptomyces sp. CMAA1738]
MIADHLACTTQLSRRAGISPASASEHAATLRRAGLTSLGTVLLDGSGSGSGTGGDGHCDVDVIGPVASRP